MAQKSLAEKMYVREGYRLLLLAAPPGYAAVLGPLPRGASLLRSSTGKADWVQLFTRSRKELEQGLPAAKRRLAPGGLLWISYAKGGSPLASDVNRDVIISVAPRFGLQAVAQVAVDSDGSAVRLKVVA
jgi:hypothetical protein